LKLGSKVRARVIEFLEEKATRESCNEYKEAMSPWIFQAGVYVLVMPDMCAAENLRRFREVVLSRPDLLARLRGVSEQEAFIGLMVQLGAEQELPFSREEVLEAIRTSRRAWRERWL
jgi:hypothetical protein